MEAPCLLLPSRAGVREVVQFIAAAMLPGDDVLDVMGKLGVFLTKQTVFATIVGATSPQVPAIERLGKRLRDRARDLVAPDPRPLVPEPTGVSRAQA